MAEQGACGIYQQMGQRQGRSYPFPGAFGEGGEVLAQPGTAQVFPAAG